MPICAIFSLKPYVCELQSYTNFELVLAVFDIQIHQLCFKHSININDMVLINCICMPF